MIYRGENGERKRLRRYLLWICTLYMCRISIREPSKMYIILRALEDFNRALERIGGYLELFQDIFKNVMKVGDTISFINAFPIYTLYTIDRMQDSLTLAKNRFDMTVNAPLSLSLSSSEEARAFGKTRVDKIIKRLSRRKFNVQYARIKLLRTLYRPVMRHKISRYISRCDII